jgi:serine/threonine protein phosphatase PrpC
MNDNMPQPPEPADDTIPEAENALDGSANLTYEDQEQYMADYQATPPQGLPLTPTREVGGTRRLPSLEEALVRPSKGVSFGFTRDIGMVRTNNEDAVFTLFSSQHNAEDNPDFGIFIVADGAGGHQSGELASTVISRILVEEISREIYQPMLLQHIQVDAPPLPPISEVMSSAVKKADEQVKKEVPGGGSTLTAVVVIGDLAHISHVGDSRAYLLTVDSSTDIPRLEQLTRDHSVAKRLEEIGQITAAEAAGHPEASRLWKIVGLTDNLEPDINTRRLPANSHLLLCSDGLWNMVTEDEIISIILTSGTPQEATDRLIVAANGGGGVDNISAIVVNFP